MAFVTPFISSIRSSNSTHTPAISTRLSQFNGRQLHSVRIFAPLNTPCNSTWKMAISSNDFRPGTTIEVDGIVFRVIEFLHVKPGKGAAFVRTKLKNMRTGSNIEKTFKAGEMVASANLEKVAMQHTYIDGDDYVFMNMESYEEERLSRKTLGENVMKFLTEGSEVEVLMFETEVLGVELPKTLSFTVTRTDPGVKGNTAQSGGGTKPATIETGAEVMVPLFIKEGEKILVNTEDGKYLGRDNK